MKNTLKIERVKKGMTQEALANAIGVSRQTIHSIESGKYSPSAVLVLKICAELGVKVEEVFELEDSDYAK